MRYYIGYIYIIINIISIWNHVNNDVKKRKTLYVYIIIFIINYLMRLRTPGQRLPSQSRLITLTYRIACKSQMLDNE